MKLFKKWTLTKVVCYIGYYFFAIHLPESYSYHAVGRVSKAIRVFFCKKLFRYTEGELGVEAGASFGTGEKISILDHGNIGINCRIGGEGQVIIGRHVMMGMDCLILTQNHKYTSSGFSGLEAGDVEIGDRVWIGARCTILKGVRIGQDAIIGAGAVVTRDIPARAIAVGVPARVIKFRPNGDTSEALIAKSSNRVGKSNVRKI